MYHPTPNSFNEIYETFSTITLHTNSSIMLAKIYLEERTEGLACIPIRTYFIFCRRIHFSFLCTVIYTCPPFNEVPKRLMRERSLANEIQDFKYPHTKNY